MARSQAQAGHCLVAWSTVCLPIQLRGLGISWSQEYDVGAENEMCVAAKKGASSPLGNSAYTSTSGGQGLFLNHSQNRNRWWLTNFILDWPLNFMGSAMPIWLLAYLLYSKEKNSKMYCSRRPHKPHLGFRFTGTIFSGSFNWLLTSLGSLIGFRTASWCQR